MSIESWALYLSILFFATASPGPAALFVMKSSIQYGNKKAMYGILGNLVGLLCLGIISITGLGTILNTSETIFNGIKYAGAIYLIYLGTRQLVQAKIKTEILITTQEAPSVKNHKVFTGSLLIALTNPKAVVLMFTLFPQFIQMDKPVFAQFLQLATILMLFSFSFLTIYATLAGKMRRFINNQQRIQIFNKISGSILITFGVLMLRISK